jgi:antirestriction protein ArdC
MGTSYNNKIKKGRVKMSKVKEYILNDIIKGLDRGVLPWQNPSFGKSIINGDTKKRYSLLNIAWLSAQIENENKKTSGVFLTWNQIKKHKGSVNTGAKSYHVAFYKIMEFENKTVKGEIEEKKFPYLRYYNVFDLNDTNITKEALKIKELPPNTGIDHVLEFVTKTGATVNHDNISVNCYYPKRDIISLNPKENFKSKELYCHTLLHELTHWTGHESRLKRDTLENYSQSGAIRSKEELIAEMGSTLLCNQFNIVSHESKENTQAYINGWVSYLKNKKDELISAFSQADKAVNFLNELQSKGVTNEN